MFHSLIDSVETGAQANVVDPRHPLNVIYMSWNDSIRTERHVISCSGAGGEEGKKGPSLTDGVVDGRILAAAEEQRVEVDHDKAAVLGDRLQDVVLHVPTRVAQLVGGRVGEDDRRLGDFQGIAHCAHRRVRQVDNHSQAVHLLDYDLRQRQQRILVSGGFCFRN